jgi:ABC-type glycerol-3-phosphate transport system substrate-binding protein
MKRPPARHPDPRPDKASRRRFLRTSVLASGGLAAALTLRRAPAYAQKRQLTILAWTHFVPDSDKEFDRQAAEWGKMTGVDVRVDHIAHLQLPAKRASEAQAGTGHDVMQFGPGDSAIYEQLLSNLDDVTQGIGTQGGGWEQLARTVSERDGHWKTVPWFYISFPLAWRTDLFEEVGEKAPDTWEDLLRAGKKLKAKGHPLGLQFGHSNDRQGLEDDHRRLQGDGGGARVRQAPAHRGERSHHHGLGRRVEQSLSGRRKVRGHPESDQRVVVDRQAGHQGAGQADAARPGHQP